MKTDSKKICILGNAQSIHVQKWIQYFINNYHRVYLLSPLWDNCQEGINFYYLKPSPVRWRYLQVLTEEFLYPYQAMRAIRKINPHIVHAFYAEFHGWLGALSQFHPFIISVFGGDVCIDPQKSRWTKAKVSFALQHADVITTQTKSMMQFLTQEFLVPPEKIRQIPWGVDLNVFYKGYDNECRKLRKELGILNDAPIILSPRQMNPLYQIDKIINAMPGVIKKFPQTTFVFISSLDPADRRQYQNQIKNLAQNLHVIKNTRFLTKPLTSRDMAILLNMSHVAISIPKIDQFGLTVIEAMACGCIPLVNELECYAEYLTNRRNAFIIHESAPSRISKILIDCIENGETRNKFYNINRNIVSSSEDWSQNASKMEDLYNYLVEKFNTRNKISS